MTQKTKVVIAEDYQLLRAGIRSLLESRDDIHVVGEAADGLEAIRCVRKERPDLLLLDISMPRLDGISVIKEARRQFPELKILVLTMHESDQHVLEAFEAGAKGYLLKDSSPEELFAAIDGILAGKIFISREIAGDVIEAYLHEGSAVKLKDKSSWDTISSREREVLKLIAEGYTNKEIGSTLNISSKTVESHRSNIMNKLDLHNVAALAIYAVGKGLVASET